jgi:Methylase of polypeptide chain release factors
MATVRQVIDGLSEESLDGHTKAVEGPGWPEPRSYPGARVTAVDSSPDALALARENSETLDLAIDLHEAGLEAVEEGWDLVVSNPPYVAASEWDSLQPEVRDWEPRAALVGEGLHEEIARRAHTLRLVLEVGDDQAETVAESLESLGYSSVTITPDLATANASSRAAVERGHHDERRPRW